jgi:hypothetical protein
MVEALIIVINQAYGNTPPNIEHVCDNQSALTVTWKVQTISIFNNGGPNADVTMVDHNDLTTLVQEFTAVTPCWVQGHADKHGLPYTLQEEVNTRTDKFVEKAQTDLTLT